MIDLKVFASCQLNMSDDNRHRRPRPVHMAAARGKVDVARQGIIFEMFTFDMFNLTRFNRQLSFLIFKVAC